MVPIREGKSGNKETIGKLIAETGQKLKLTKVLT
jgi:hypothetical protein